MNLILIAWKNIHAERVKKMLNIILLASGIAVINIILLVDHQVKEKLEANAGKVDMVIGAKGSPLQLILSGIYHVDFPTGNINLNEVKPLLKHPYVKESVPIAMGDSYNGVRIVGTNQDFFSFYDLKMAKGISWKREFEAVAGANAARVLNIKQGNTFHSSHGLTPGGDVHNNEFTLTGILEKSGTVTDDLIFTGLETIWHMHEHAQIEQKEEDKEITALLIKYTTPLAVPVFPRIVNNTGALQSASPALETARLYALLGSGFDLVRAFGILIILLAAFSVFIVLYTSLSERKTELALFRTMGASRQKVFFLILIEGIIISLIGTIAGLFTAHMVLVFTDYFFPLKNMAINGFVFIPGELLILLFGIIAGILASVIPAIGAYKTAISTVLAKA